MKQLPWLWSAIAILSTIPIGLIMFVIIDTVVRPLILRRLFPMNSPVDLRISQHSLSTANCDVVLDRGKKGCDQKKLENTSVEEFIPTPVQPLIDAYLQAIEPLRSHLYGIYIFGSI